MPPHSPEQLVRWPELPRADRRMDRARVPDIGHSGDRAGRRAVATDTVAPDSAVADGRCASIRMIVADDHTLFREGIVEICGLEPDLTVVGQARTGHEAVRLVLRERPDVVLLDVEMAGSETAEVLAAVLRAPCAPRVAMLSMHDDARMIGKLVRLGARAYISKSATREQLLAAVRTVAGDREQVVLSVPRTTMAQLGRPTPDLLSDRQLDVLGLVAT